MKILQITAHFPPNVGGVETHLDDLVKALTKRDWKVTVLTYRPLTTPVDWKLYEKSLNLEILRIPWFPYLFYKLVSLPLFEFLYLLPGLFLITPFVLLKSNPDVIHAHGLVAGFVGVFWGKLFGKRVVISTHSIYHFPKQGLYRSFVRWIFVNADQSLGLSKQAVEEIESLDIPETRVDNFTYWINLDRFKRVKDAKNILGWKDKFMVLFVGRLIEEKGILVLLESFKSWDKKINLVVIGNGPLEGRVRKIAQNIKNIEFVGRVTQDQLPTYYSASDILIVPSISEEGFGRVILESLSCGTPVIGAKIGAIPEALDKSVGKLIDIPPRNIKETVEYFFDHQDELRQLAKNCREFAKKKYSEKNVNKIIKAYTS